MDVDAYTTMRFERRNRVLTVFLDDPAEPDRSDDAAIHEELGQLFRDLRDEREARAVVLTGSGQNFFAGLGDAPGSLLWQREAGLDVIESGRQVARRLIWDLLDIEVPIVAAVSGIAATLGATIALTCDAVFMADTAVLQDAHVRLGVAAGDGAAGIWPVVMGPALAKRYLLTGDPITAQDAAAMGIVTHVSPRATMLTDATAFAERLAAGAPLALRYTKMAVNRAVKDAIGGAFEQGLGHEMLTFMSEDLVEAVSASRESRTAVFKGK